jgi:hypothetical protein
MTVMREERLSTGAPMPPPAWQLICEFANGACVCAATRGEGPPCHAVEVITTRIKNTIAAEELQARKAKAKR